LQYTKLAAVVTFELKKSTLCYRYVYIFSSMENDDY